MGYETNRLGASCRLLNFTQKKWNLWTTYFDARYCNLERPTRMRGKRQYFIDKFTKFEIRTRGRIKACFYLKIFTFSKILKIAPGRKHIPDP